jgi:hypothetical protein
MRSKILAVSTTLALGTGLGGLAYAAVREAPAAMPSTGTVSPTPSSTPDVCRNPASDDPQCVTVVQVPVTAPQPAATKSASRTPATRGSDDGTADHGRGNAGALRNDVSGADGGGDDGTADQGRGTRSDDSSGSGRSGSGGSGSGRSGSGRSGSDDSGPDDSGGSRDDGGRHSGADDGTADQGHGDN